jgi:D-amino-acid oxidase
VRIGVIGAGVVGLTLARRLLTDGHDVLVLAAAGGTDTTSSVAAALWYPYLVAPAHDTRWWGRRTYVVLGELARTTPEAGVDMRHGHEHVGVPQDPPDWHEDVAGFRSSAHGWSFDSPVADMSLYLPWLAEQVRTAGGRIEVGHEVSPQTLPAARDLGQDALVLATGLGSRHLAADPTVRPVRGQVVLVEQMGLDEWHLDGSDAEVPTYVVPRRDVVVCGGTALGDRWDTAPEPATTTDILRRCAELVPAVADARVVDVRVGLRPVRPAVRLERADALGPGDLPLITCYGHGGAGVTLSWGCADDVAGMVADL